MGLNLPVAVRYAGAAVLLCVMVVSDALSVDFPDLVPLVKALKPVVVNISTTQNAKAGRDPSLPPDAFKDSPFDEFFRQFLERMPQQNFESKSLGSGVIIDADGSILTNNHVVESADEIQVRLADEREFSAKVVGRDAKTDLALIRIQGAGKLPVARLGDSEKAEVGSWVIAIGNPFGLEATVTSGIISAKGRMIGNGPYDNFLQTDAAINPGNSGGPLFNLAGDVIGINTAIFSRSGGNMGIGFATPINMAKSIVTQLKEHGRVTRGWLGVRIQGVTQELAQALGLEKREGALVASVENGSPAQKAGVESGDVIIRFDGKDVRQMKELPTIVAGTEVGKKVTMDVVRDKKQLTLQVVIALMDDEPAVAAASKDKGTSLGLTVQPLTPELKDSMKLEKDVQGVVVTEVEKGGVAAQAGVQRGDVVAEINRKPIRKLSDFLQATSKPKPGETLLVLLFRDGDPLFLAVHIPAK